MDTEQILAEVKAEISRLQRVVDLLEDGTTTSPRETPVGMDPKTKAKLSRGMKRRWAAKKAAGGMSGGGKRKGHQWTDAERKAMSLKQKARWAAKKKGKKA